MRIGAVPNAAAGLLVITLLAAPCISYANLQEPTSRVATGNLPEQWASQVSSKQETTSKTNVGTGAADVPVKPGSSQQTFDVSAPASVKVDIKPNSESSVDVSGKPVTNCGGRKLQESGQVVNVQAPAGVVVDVKPDGSGIVGVFGKSITTWGGRKLQESGQAVNVQAPAGVVVDVKPGGSGTVNVFGKPLTAWGGRKLRHVT